MANKQQTIQKEISLSGVGLHTGKEVQLTFKPAPENHGYAFVRTDLKEKKMVLLSIHQSMCWQLL